MKILAHRGNLEGPDRAAENRLDTMARALTLGFGLETDIRRLDHGPFYISHDLRTDIGEAAEDHVRLWAQHPRALIALNIKEIGHEADTLALLRAHGLHSHYFLFDMELIETESGATAQALRAMDPTVPLASRASDRGESIEHALGLPGPYVWLDEMDGTWATAEDITRLKNAGRQVIGVSRDLHGLRPDACFRRWEEFARWGLDGICTDWPLLLAERLGEILEEA